MGEQDLSWDLQDEESFRRGSLGISISGERNSVSNGEEVEKGLVYIWETISVWLEQRICANSSRRETKKVKCSQMGEISS